MAVFAYKSRQKFLIKKRSSMMEIVAVIKGLRLALFRCNPWEYKIKSKNHFFSAAHTILQSRALCCAQ
jgi:hypothetical protein